MNNEKFNTDGVKSVVGKLETEFENFAEELKKINDIMNDSLNIGPDSTVFGSLGSKLLGLWNKNSATFGDFYQNFDSWSKVVAVISANNQEFMVAADAIYRDNGGKLDGVSNRRAELAKNMTFIYEPTNEEKAFDKDAWIKNDKDFNKIESSGEGDSFIENFDECPTLFFDDGFEIRQGAGIMPGSYVYYLIVKDSMGNSYYKEIKPDANGNFEVNGKKYNINDGVSKDTNLEENNNTNDTNVIDGKKYSLYAYDIKKDNNGVDIFRVTRANFGDDDIYEQIIEHGKAGNTIVIEPGISLFYDDIKITKSVSYKSTIFQYDKANECFVEVDEYGNEVDTAKRFTKLINEGIENENDGNHIEMLIDHDSAEINLDEINRDQPTKTASGKEKYIPSMVSKAEGEEKEYDVYNDCEAFRISHGGYNKAEKKIRAAAKEHKTIIFEPGVKYTYGLGSSIDNDVLTSRYGNTYFVWSDDKGGYVQANEYGVPVGDKVYDIDGFSVKGDSLDVY